MSNISTGDIIRLHDKSKQDVTPVYTCVEAARGFPYINAKMFMRLS